MNQQAVVDAIAEGLRHIDDGYGDPREDDPDDLSFYVETFEGDSREVLLARLAIALKDAKAKAAEHAEQSGTLKSLDRQLQDERRRSMVLSRSVSPALEDELARLNREMQRVRAVDEALATSMRENGDRCGIVYGRHGYEDWPRVVVDELLQLRRKVGPKKAVPKLRLPK
jgi:hypothetical protein